MKFNAYARGAVALALGLAVSAAYAEGTILQDDFESYTVGASIHGLGTWTAGDGDQSVIATDTPVNDTKVLKVATDGTTLTNTFGSTSIAEQSVYMDADVLFVPSEELSAFDVEAEGNRDLKLGLYSYKPEGAETASLVIFHSFKDGDANTWRTNDVTGVEIPTNSAVHVKVVMKHYPGDREFDAPPTAFSVAINGTPVTSLLAYPDSALDSTDDYSGAMAQDGTGTMFLIANLGGEDTAEKNVSALNVTGTGYLDNITVGLVGSEPPPPPPPAGYAENDSVTGEGATTVTLTAAQADWLNALKDAKGMTKDAMDAALQTGDGDGYGIDAEYLLNSDPLVATDVAFAIENISISGTDVQVSVKLTRTEDGAALASAVNGAIAILSSDTVDGIYAEPEGGAALETGATEGTWQGAGKADGAKKFFKAELR